MGQRRHRQGNQRLGIHLRDHAGISRLRRRVHEEAPRQVGCRRGLGDWSFSSAINWGDASYLGIDIAADVIETVRRKHEKGTIKFQVGDITEALPAADLLISKDVLQHLSNELIHKFIKNNLRKGKYKWVILTNDRSSENRDISTGDYRMIDLAAPPFEIKGLIDLPIKFGTETRKITSLLDLTQQQP